MSKSRAKGVLLISTVFFSDASPKASSSSAACQERAQGVDPQTGQLDQEEHHLEELDEVGEDNPLSAAGQF